MTAPDRGEVWAATSWPTNADMIRDIIRLGYFDPQSDDVADLTYGDGNWWADDTRPTSFVAHDLYKLDGVDFRALPEPDGTYDAVMYDPPYVCVSLDTEILTDRGWLTYDRVTTSDRALTFNMNKEVAEWQPILGVGVYPAGSHLVSVEGTAHSSLTTPNHRWPARRRSRRSPTGMSAYEFVRSDSFLAEHVVPIAAECVGHPDAPVHTDAFVEAVAWFWTEGHVDRGRDGTPGGYSNIVQKFDATDRCDRIRACLTSWLGPPVDRFPRLGRVTDGAPRWRESRDGHKAVFWLSADAGRQLQRHAPDRVPTHDFILSLTADQLDLFIEVSLLADGHIGQRGAVTLGQKNRAAAEAFQFAAILAGHATSIHPHSQPPPTLTIWTVRLRRRRALKPRRQRVEHVAVPAGTLVWCPRTPNETWLARRNGTVYFTGNCQGGRKTTTVPDFHDAYGIGVTAPRTPAALQEMINAGLAEVRRVLRPPRRVDGELVGGVAVVKCMNYITSGSLWPGAHYTLDAALALGFKVEEMWPHVGTPGPQPKDRTRKHAACRGHGCDGCDDGQVPSRQQHARNNYSMCYVLRRDRQPVTSPPTLDFDISK